jgi:hypothetical protein
MIGGQRNPVDRYLHNSLNLVLFLGLHLGGLFDRHLAFQTPFFICHCGRITPPYSESNINFFRDVVCDAHAFARALKPGRYVAFRSFVLVWIAKKEPVDPNIQARNWPDEALILALSIIAPNQWLAG